MNDMINKMRQKSQGKPVPKPAPLPVLKKKKHKRTSAKDRDANWFKLGRLPDGSVIQAHYNGLTTTWTVLLTVPGSSFTASGDGHFACCQECFKQYLAWKEQASKLTAEPAAVIKEE